MDASRPRIEELAPLLLSFAGASLAAGAHSERCVRTVSRLASAYDCEAAITISQKNIGMSLVARQEPTVRHTAIHRQRALVFNFSRIAMLSALSWRAVDEKLPLPELQREFRRIMEQPARPAALLVPGIAAANAAFCQLFGGDAAAMALVFAGTALGYATRRWLTARRVNHFGSVVICAFLSSMVATLAFLCHWGDTPGVALGTSVLYLVPGVQLINTLMDLINGYLLNGYQRGISTLITIICMAIGLSLSVLLTGVQASPQL